MKTSCSKYGVPCYLPEVKEANYECNANLSVPVFKTYPFSNLDQVTFRFDNSEDSAICCIDKTHYKQYHGKDCLKLNSAIIPKCKFSSEFALYPCSKKRQQERSKFCKVPGWECVVQTTYVSLCGGIEQFPCDVKNVNCERSTNVVKI